jgi:LmbE family N-acetylglucosaminyl deacetylase
MKRIYLARHETMNPYRQFVAKYVRLAAAGKHLPLGGIPPRNKPALTSGAPVALIFSPHPDDECITGALALRLLRETRMGIINVAVTLGSDKKRRRARLRELKNACAWIGFGLEATGLEKIDPVSLAENPGHLQAAVKVVADLLARFQPRAIFFPHEADWHATHIGTHFLVLHALKTLPRDFQTMLVETEFWGQMASPNLMVESGADDVADLLAALSFHAGEMRRNPYHLRLPAWMQDNVRRGAELAGGPGTDAPEFTFATLYRLRRWKNRRAEYVFSGGRKIGASENPSMIFSDRSAGGSPASFRNASHSRTRRPRAGKSVLA